MGRLTRVACGSVVGCAGTEVRDYQFTLDQLTAAGGQIVLARDLDRQDIYPPVNVLPSLSRLMDYGTGEGYTNADHPALASQLFAAYANARRVRVLASVMGEEGLSDTDRDYLRFGDLFESRLINQAGARSLDESMAVAWEVLAVLPDSELTRLSNEQISRNVRRKS